MKNKTLGFTATFGRISGYGHENENPVSIEDFAILWRQNMQRLFESTGILIGCVIQESRVVYPVSFGCPNTGELTFTVSGHYNPKFFDIKKYSRKRYLKLLKDNTIRLCDDLRKQLGQTTLSLTFYKIDHFEYIISK